MRLIDANEVLKSCVDEKGNYLGHDAAVVGEAVSAAPTVNAVPVVRCKDCKHLSVRSGALGVYQCAILGDYPSGECFCSYGERKEATPL